MRFGITSAAGSGATASDIKKLVKILKRGKHDIVVESALSKFLGIKEKSKIKSMNVDMVLAVGDNFNVLRTFHELGKKRTPVLGVSTSPADFLCEIDIDQFDTALEFIEKGNHFIEEKSRLQLEVDGKSMPLALNDVVVSSRKGSTIISYSLAVDGKVILKDTADGIIISTPTGSTGYSLSAGGPVVFSDSKVFVATPICSLNQNKPLVLDDESVIEIKSVSSRVGCEVVIDGHHRENLDSEKVKITKSRSSACFVKFKDFGRSVLEKLRKRAEDTGMLAVGAPPSAKFIFKILQYEGRMTQKEIVKATSLPPRTVRSALSYLLKNKVISQKTSLRDARHSIYYINSA